MESMGVHYWYVKMALGGCVEHWLEYITFYVQKYIAHLVACSGHPLVCDRPLGAPAFVKLTYTRQDLSSHGSDLFQPEYSCFSTRGFTIFMMKVLYFLHYMLPNNYSIMTSYETAEVELSSYPGYFWEPHWKSMGLLEISWVTWQLCIRYFWNVVIFFKYCGSGITDYNISSFIHNQITNLWIHYWLTWQYPWSCFNSFYKAMFKAFLQNCPSRLLYSFKWKTWN